MTLAEAKSKYFEVGKNYQGTSGDILTEMCKLTRSLGRQLLQDDPRQSKRKLAEAFREIAEECHQTAIAEEWMNDYALGIADEVRRAIISLKHSF